MVQRRDIYILYEGIGGERGAKPGGY